LEGEENRLLFDLSDLEYLSSGGLRVILSAAKEIRRRDGKVALAALKQYVYEIFDVSGFTSMIPIKEALAALKQYVYEIFDVSGFTSMIPIKDTVEEGLKDLA
jgi:anti-anti-sigma regulatory factor